MLPSTDKQLSVTHAKIGLRLDSYIIFEYNKKQVKDFTNHLGISESGLKNLLSGKRDISLTEIQKLAVWFNTTPEKVLQANF